ncbi:hypothetical protein BX661DRAFT_176554 [Kickxella alabastrina]|uniref:uncharacterized protein n=1 Tax=Kickxella alabastrina TaxID=61397 RepID=UPI00221F05ED|nr:uncharacterized protein BX661DRAFT_176554 [Kickxella alabastrina]KAI7834058.1 hypothetical protein BX661DRAFT_176554 [Kickxella alabastrina]
MQVGWCLDQCRVFPEGGESVRYDLQSISYDGMQICKWYVWYSDSDCNIAGPRQAQQSA